jgi:hypothetical protein
MADDRHHGHQFGVGPSAPDVDVVPLTEGGVADTEGDRQGANGGPAAVATKNKRESYRRKGNQDVAAGAMHRRKDLLTQVPVVQIVYKGRCRNSQARLPAMITPK